MYAAFGSCLVKWLITVNVESRSRSAIAGLLTS
jgi:hypothetical protein